MIRSRVLFPAVAALVAAESQLPSASADIFQFDLIGRSGPGMRFDNENTTAIGSATGGEIGAGIFYDDVINLLTVNVGWGSGNGFTDLTGPVTVAHIHQAPNALLTSTGPVIVNMDGATPGFNNSPTNGGWFGTTVTLTPAQELSLFAGVLYLNAHTAVNPSGELRGNMVVIPAPASLSLLALAGLVGARRRRR